MVDLDWSWINTLSGMSVGELRVADKIGTHDNLRIIFFVDSRPPEGGMPVIWILHVFQKKTDHFTTAALATIRARRLIVLGRW